MLVVTIAGKVDHPTFTSMILKINPDPSPISFHRRSGNTRSFLHHKTSPQKQRRLGPLYIDLRPWFSCNGMMNMFTLISLPCNLFFLYWQPGYMECFCLKFGILKSFGFSTQRHTSIGSTIHIRPDVLGAQTAVRESSSRPIIWQHFFTWELKTSIGGWWWSLRNHGEVRGTLHIKS